MNNVRDAGLDVRHVGIDTHEPSVVRARLQGHEVICADLTDLLNSPGELPATFEHVVGFHCLEHVADPVGFVSMALQFLSPGGMLHLSTPLSPLSSEALWFDPLNHPPHHLTQWSCRSYECLAESSGAFLDRLSFPESTPLRRTVRSLRLRHWGPFPRYPAPVLSALSIARSPRLFIGELRRQQQLARKGPLHADIVLAQFRGCGSAP
jgi:SAM-dependent methyltransferase